ncbi:ArsR/SmtB family transcription factor [Spirillospora sp. NPDC127200]
MASVPVGRAREGTALSTMEKRLRALEARVTELEERLAAAPGGTAGTGGGTGGDAGDHEDTGHVGYGGTARLGGYEWSWQVTRAPGWLLERPAAPLAAVLQAAGQPARLEVLRLLLTGPRTVAELQSELGLGSTGQLYHHLKALTGAGLVEQTERAVYRLPGRAVFPLLAMLSAANDVSSGTGAT